MTPELLQRALSITASAKSAKATLKRAGKIYAKGTLTRTKGHLRLALNVNRRKTLPTGPYNVSLSWKAGKTTHTSRQRIALK